MRLPVSVVRAHSRMESELGVTLLEKARFLQCLVQTVQAEVVPPALHQHHLGVLTEHLSHQRHVLFNELLLQVYCVRGYHDALAVRTAQATAGTGRRAISRLPCRLRGADLLTVERLADEAQHADLALALLVQGIERAQGAARAPGWPASCSSSSGTISRASTGSATA